MLRGGYTSIAEGVRAVKLVQVKGRCPSPSDQLPKVNVNDGATLCIVQSVPTAHSDTNKHRLTRAPREDRSTESLRRATGSFLFRDCKRHEQIVLCVREKPNALLQSSLSCAKRSKSGYKVDE